MIAKNSAKLNPKYRRKRTNARTMADVAFDAQKLAFAPFSFQAALSLRDLGILNLLNQAPAADKELAQKTKLSLYAVQTLLENGVCLGLVQKTPAGLYDITKTGWFWLCDPMTRANADFVNDVCYLGMHSLQKSLKTGKPTGLKVFGKWKTVYEGLSKLPPKARKSWFTFDHFYSDIAFPEILPLVFSRGPRQIVDIGANTGKWAKKCLEYSPDVKITLVDLPGQLAVAKKNLKKFGARAAFWPANVLDPNAALPPKADAVLMSQFLDCFSEKQITDILKKVKKAAGPHTDIYILEPLWDRQEFAAAAYCLNHTSLYFTNIANGNSKMYAFEQLKNCIENAGLTLKETFNGVGRFAYTLLRCGKK